MRFNELFFLNTVTDIKETATAVNFTLMKLIALQDENEQGDVLRPSTGMFFFILNPYKRTINMW